MLIWQGTHLHLLASKLGPLPGIGKTASQWEAAAAISRAFPAAAGRKRRTAPQYAHAQRSKADKASGQGKRRA